VNRIPRPPFTSAALSLFLAVLAQGLLPPANAQAGDDAPVLCFDFSKPGASIQPLHAPIAYSTPAHADTLDSGNLAEGGWGAARAQLQMPIALALELLRDHTTLKDPKDCDLDFKHQSQPGYLDFEKVEVTIHPFPLVNPSWQEEWAFSVPEGTAENPARVVISYQKTAGTSHIHKFCGNIVLTPVNAETTDIAIYEEADAYRRSPEAIAKGHLGTLRTLRERAIPILASRAQKASPQGVAIHTDARQPASSTPGAALQSPSQPTSQLSSQLSGPTTGSAPKATTSTRH
jgi:hypothetical protein